MRIKRLPIAGLLAVLGVVAVAGVLQSAWSGAAEVAVPVSAEDKAVLHRAEERLIKQCMTAAGFEYYEIAPKSSAERRFPFVVDDVAWARVNGYAAQKPRTAAPSSAYLKSLSPERKKAWRAQLLGAGRQISVELTGGQRLWTSDNGCIADARRALDDDLPRWFNARRITDNLPYFVATQVRADPAYAEAMKDWAGCVRRHGYDADDPGELASLVAVRTKGAAGSAIRAAQIAATVTEATCANSTSMVRTVRGVGGGVPPQDHRRTPAGTPGSRRPGTGRAPPGGGTALGDCPSGYFCAWADDDATGHRAQWEGDDAWWGDDGMHDNAETVYNNGVEHSEDVVAIYYDLNYKGFAFCMDRGEWLDWDMDDNDYDSHLWTSGC